MKNSYINKMGQVIQPKDLEKTIDEINGAVDKAKLYPTPVNADKGKYLKYDESGNIIFDDVPSSEIPTITITAEQVVSVNPITVTLTNEQLAIFNSDNPINIYFEIEGYLNYSGTALMNIGIDGRYIILGQYAVYMSNVLDNDIIIKILEYIVPYANTTAGQIPVADGQGGFTWQTPSGGSGSGHTVTIQNVTTGGVVLVKIDGTRVEVNTPGTHTNVLAIEYNQYTIQFYTGRYTTDTIYEQNGSIHTQTEAYFPLTDIVISDITSGGGGN